MDVVGAGTVLDAMRLGLRMLVVPNESLLDNHQKELAEELESQGYATMSDTKYGFSPVTSCLLLTLLILTTAKA